MLEVAGSVALSIFLTVSLFLTIYTLAYGGIVLLIKAVQKIKAHIKKT